jgi:IS30 family transposase
MRVRLSHETICKSLLVQSRGVLAKELQKHLHSRRPTRRNVHNTVTGRWRSQIKNAVSIRERPAEVEDRAVPGRWEGDLLLGRHWTQIATAVERASRRSSDRRAATRRRGCARGQRRRRDERTVDVTRSRPAGPMTAAVSTADQSFRSECSEFERASLGCAAAESGQPLFSANRREP